MSKKFATLRDVSGGNDGGHDSGEESDGPDGQSFFVGGSEHSGQQVLGPPKGGRGADGRDVADQLFRAARSSGADVVDPAEAQGGSSSRPRGGGVRLGDAVVGPQRVEAEPEPESRTAAVTMTAYENGFVIDDGEFRPFADPANAAFLSDIAAGRLPRELVLAHPGKEVDLKMQRRAGPYEPPKVRLFGGEGHRLGAVVPEVVGVEAPAPPPSAEEAADLLKEAQAAIKLDESKPVTQLQIRLPDGRRLIGRFNTSATVTDVRAFVAAAAPELAFAPFELRTSYPNAPVNEEGATLESAALLNSVLLMGVKELLGLDKLAKLASTIQKVGGVKAALKQRYLMDTTRVGTLVGEDKFGNRYYEDNAYFMPRNRWVVYPEKVWLDYDASQVPPEWHRWLHHIGDETPTTSPPVKEKWVLDHVENTSIFPDKKYVPYATSRTKIEAWQPPKGQ